MKRNIPLILTRCRLCLRIFFPYSILTNGQMLCIATPLISQKKEHLIFLKIDFFSNTIWKVLDQPKMIITLVRFTRKFLKNEAVQGKSILAQNLIPQLKETLLNLP